MNTLKYVLFIQFLLFGLPFLLSAEQPLSRIEEDSQVNLVVIDPGHGGKDEGAVYGNIYEKDIVLDIALKLGNFITSNFPETKVTYTRTKDVFVPLHQRADLANKNKADLFISIHINYVNSTKVQGTETFVLGHHRDIQNLEVAKKENAVILLEEDYASTYEGFDNSTESYIMFQTVQEEYFNQSVMLASAIQKEFSENASRIDRSVKEAGFLVLWQTTMPSVLVEAGFLSNVDERKFLTSEAGRMSLASSIFNAFKDYKEKIEKKNNFNLITEKPNIVADTLSIQKIKKKIVEKNLNNNTKGKIFFSVQIAALRKQLEINSDIFMGEKEVFRLNSGKIFHYCSGKFSEFEKAKEEKQRLETKFADAFIVAIEDDKLISVKKAMRKM